MDDALLVANRFVALGDGTHLDLATATTAALTRGTIADEARLILGGKNVKFPVHGLPHLRNFTVSSSGQIRHF